LTKKEPGMLKKFSNWIEAEDDTKVEIIRKPGKSFFEQAKEFLFEEVPVVEEKTKPKKKEKGIWKKFIDWLEAEDKPKSKPKIKPKPKLTKKEPGMFQRFSDWLMEEDEPKAKPQVKPKPQVRSKKSKKEKGIWKKFIDWLEEED